jgi:hypothetical protein
LQAFQAALLQTLQECHARIAGCIEGKHCGQFRLGFQTCHASISARHYSMAGIYCRKALHARQARIARSNCRHGMNSLQAGIAVRLFRKALHAWQAGIANMLEGIAVIAGKSGRHRR